MSLIDLCEQDKNKEKENFIVKVYDDPNAIPNTEIIPKDELRQGVERINMIIEARLKFHKQTKPLQCEMDTCRKRFKTLYQL